MATDLKGNLIPDLEPLLDMNSFGLTRMETGIRAVAKRVNNLIFMEKGTCHDCFDMGVGIKLYLFERVQDADVKALGSRIQEQINKYLPDIRVNSVEVEVDAQKALDPKNRGAFKITIGFDESINGVNYLIIKAEARKNKEVENSFFTA